MSIIDSNTGQRITSHLTKILTGTSSLSNEPDARITNLCQYINKVTNAVDKYCNDVGNNKALSIKGSTFSIESLSERISFSEVKIKHRLAKLNAYKRDSSKFLAKQGRIFNNRLHLEQKINKAEKLVNKLDASHIRNVTGPEGSSLIEFKQAISEFKSFIIRVTVREVIQNNLSTEQQNNLPADQLDSPPSYDKCTLPTYGEAIKQAMQQ